MWRITYHDSWLQRKVTKVVFSRVDMIQFCQFLKALSVIYCVEHVEAA